MTTIRKGSGINDIFAGTDEAEAFDGVGGYDVVTYAAAKKKVVIDLLTASLNDGAAAGDTYLSIESFKLTVYDDVFKGSNGNDVVNGDAGNDTLEGRGGNDSLTGHSGSDTIRGGDGNDAIWGGGDADMLFGDAGNDQIWGDAMADVIAGGADLGKIGFQSVARGYYQYSSTHYIPIEQIDDYGEWVAVPKRHSVEDGSALTSINRAGGDAIFVVTNGYNDARDWNAIRVGGSLPPIDLGAGGRIGADSSIIFNAGSGIPTIVFAGASGLPSVKSAGSNPEGVVQLPDARPLSVTFGDTLSGGSGNDTFVFNLGDGVDRIQDFIKGQDRIDIAATLFDGNRMNGEYYAVDHAGGALIMFRDGSADGFADDTGIFLAGLKAAAVDATIFV